MLVRANNGSDTDLCSVHPADMCCDWARVCSVVEHGMRINRTNFSIQNKTDNKG